jgi:perosamine synthetase
MHHEISSKNRFIPHSKPTLGPEEVRAVSEVIVSGHIAQGEMVNKFERAVADYLGVEFALGTSSGTAALHLALLAMGVGLGDEVIIPSYACSALLNAVNYTGAAPVLADIRSDTYNLDATDVKRRLTSRTKAIIVPHLFGLPADLETLMKIEVPIIEDCAQAIGSTYQGRPVGTFGAAAIFSFYATKVITTAEGGMVVTNSSDIAGRIRDLKTYDQKQDYKVRYNYKMNDIQAAMGRVQLERLESMILRRRTIAQTYTSAFSAFDFKLPPDDGSHIYFRYVLDLKMDSAPWIQTLSRMGIACDRPIYLPLHRYQKLQGYPVAEKSWRQSLSIPIYPLLTDKEIRRVADAVCTCHEKFC